MNEAKDKTTTHSPITLELQADAVFEAGPDGPKLVRIDVRDCVLIAQAAAELMQGAPEGVTLH